MEIMTFSRVKNEKILFLLSPILVPPILARSTTTGYLNRFTL